MKIGSLFSGYGGLDLAALQLFPESVLAWHCEWDDAPAKILDHHWPTVPNHRDVTTLDWATIEPVDILTGGYPCQPFSAAGQRKGTDDERHLWPYVRDAIRLLRPRFTLLENVAGHRSLGFDRVLGDLAEDGMHVRWTSLRASDVGAPHHRERLFILVSAPNADGPAFREHAGESPAKEAWTQGGDRSSDLGGERSDQVGRDAANSSSSRPESIDGFTGRGATRGSGDGQSRGGDWRTSTNADRGECDRNERAQGRQAVGREAPAGCGAGFLANADSLRSLRCGQGSGQSSAGEAEESTAVGSVGAFYDWGTYGPAIRRWERLTRTAPAPTELNSNGRPRLNAGFAEWMMGLPAGHVTEVPGISRAHQLKAIGNGVCPQQAVAAYAALLGQAS